MNKSLWQSDIFRAACVSVALHAGIAGVLMLSISIAAPHFFNFTEPPRVLHVSWISNEAGPPESGDRIQKAGAPLFRTIASPAPARPREKQVQPATGQETPLSPQIRAIRLSLPTGQGLADAWQAAGDPASAVASLSGTSENTARHEWATPRYGENDAPVYPALARLKGYEGMVLLAAEVSADGRVESLKIKKSSGYASLDRSALEAVRHWKFEPGRRMGKPVVMWVDVPVKFVLKENDSIS